MIGLRFFPLKSADVRGSGTRDEPLREPMWEASHLLYTEDLVPRVFSPRASNQ